MSSRIVLGFLGGMGFGAGHNGMAILHMLLAKAIAQLDDDVKRRFIEVHQEEYNAIGPDIFYPSEMCISKRMCRRDRFLDGTSDNDPTNDIIACVEAMKQYGVNVIVVPCNTFMAYADRVREHCGHDTIFVDIVKETVKRTHELNFQCVGLLSTKATRDSGLYDHVASDTVRLIKLNDNDQEVAGQVIDHAKQNDHLRGDRKELVFGKMRSLIQHFEACGCDAVILGCTEFSLLPTTSYITTDNSIAIVDSVFAMANATTQLVIEDIINSSQQCFLVSQIFAQHADCRSSASVTHVLLTKLNHLIPNEKHHHPHHQSSIRC